MLPTGEAVPGAGIEAPITSERSNAALVSGSTADREDEARDLDTYGRRSGVHAEYAGGGGSAHVWIDLLDDPDTARGYLNDVVGDIAKGIGGTHEPDAIAESAAEYPVQALGDGAIGLEVALADGGTETIVLFRVGRLVAFASLTGSQDAGGRAAVEHLAEELQQNIADVLIEGHGRRPPGPGPESYGFSFEQSATVGGDTYTTASEGVVDGSSVSCRVRIDAPGLAIDRDLVLVGTTLWAREHEAGNFRAAAGGSVADRALLAYCPPWPVDVNTAGLSEAIEGEGATHTLDGRDVLGYRGDAALLADSLGVDEQGLTVEVFTLWLAATTPWVVDLRLDATGSGADLGRLVTPGIPSDALVRVVAGQQIHSLGEAGPVRPPAMVP
jgi:hypothetical protein